MKRVLYSLRGPVPKQWLYFAIAFLWIFASIRIFMIAWENTLSGQLPVAYFIIGSFFGAYLFTRLVFTKVTNRYISRIVEMEETNPSIFSMLSLKSYMLIMLMISMGIAIKYMPFIPAPVQAIFFGSLGLSLFTSAMVFFRAGRMNVSL